MMNEMYRIGVLVSLVATLGACTQETQNKFGRAIQNWTGTNGVLEIYAGDKLVRRFIEIDKLSTAVSTQGSIRVLTGLATACSTRT